mgnify:CR=1 FL=1
MLLEVCRYGLACYALHSLRRRVELGQLERRLLLAPKPMWIGLAAFDQLCHARERTRRHGLVQWRVAREALCIHLGPTYHSSASPSVPASLRTHARTHWRLGSHVRCNQMPHALGVIVQRCKVQRREALVRDLLYVDRRTGLQQPWHKRGCKGARQMQRRLCYSRVAPVANQLINSSIRSTNRSLFSILTRGAHAYRCCLLRSDRPDTPIAPRPLVAVVSILRRVALFVCYLDLDLPPTASHRIASQPITSY